MVMAENSAEYTTMQVIAGSTQNNTYTVACKACTQLVKGLSWGMQKLGTAHHSFRNHDSELMVKLNCRSELYRAGYSLDVQSRLNLDS